MRHTIRVVAVALALGLPNVGVASAAEAPAKKAAVKKAAAKNAPDAAAAIKEVLEGEDVRDFRTFCDGWMAKLRERDTYNTAHIAWNSRDGQVVGEHVSYGSERTCVAREEPGRDPIGKITYREIRYRRQGKDPAAAMAAAGTIVDQTDVTEIFRFAKGRWQY